MRICLKKDILGFGTVIVVTFVLGVTAATAATNPKMGKPHILAAGKAPAPMPPMTSELYKKMMKDAADYGVRQTARMIATDTITDTALSDSFRNLRNEIIGGKVIKDGVETGQQNPAMTTASQLHDLMKKLNDDKYYASLDPDARFAAAQMAPLIVFHGFFNRALELIERKPIAHMAVVGALRTFASGVLAYFPTDQWSAGVQYITMPSDDMGDLISTEDALQEFVENQLIPAVRTMEKRLSNLSFAQKPIYFDNRVFYGSAHFSSDKDQYVRIGEVERYNALSNAYYLLSSLESVNAYSMNGLFKAMDTLAGNYGFDSALAGFASRISGSLGSFAPDKTDAKSRFKVLTTICQEDGLFTLRVNGQGWMNDAHVDLTYAVANANSAWNALKESPPTSTSQGVYGAGNPATFGNIIDARSFAGGSRIGQMAMNNLRYIALADGSSAQSAIISTENRKISLENFYTHAPPSLVALMPNDFDPAPYRGETTYNGKSRPYRNYNSGRPTSWPIAEYQKLFGAQIQTKEDVMVTARILSQSWGGWILGVPMSALIL